jgi:hypothetical protein
MALKKVKEIAHQIVSCLVQRFDEQKESYKKAYYNEAGEIICFAAEGKKQHENKNGRYA